jgi:zinc protease
MVLVIVGDVENINTEKFIKKVFSSMSPSKSNVNETALKNIDRKKSEAFYHYEKEAGKTEISIGITKNIEPIPDGYEYRKNLIAETITSIIINLRLQSLMEKEKTPFTDAYFYTGDFLNRYMYSFITLETDPDKWKETLEKGRIVVEQVFKYGFTNEEFETAKKILLSNLKSAAESEKTRKSDNIASSIINDLNSNKVILSPKQKYKLYKKISESLDNIKILNHLKEIWNNQPRLILVTGNLKLPKKPEKLIFDEYKKTDSIKIKPFNTKSNYKFPYLFPENKNVNIVNETFDKNLRIKSVKLDNNIIINMKKTDFRKNKVNIAVSIGYGKFYLNENLRGIGEITQYVINESGLGKISLSDLYKVLADKNIDLECSINKDSFEISGKADKEHLNSLIQLVYHQIKDPGFRKNIYDNYLKQLKLNEKGLLHTVNGQYRYKVERFLRGNDPRFGMSTFEEQSRFSLEDIKHWFLKNINNAPMEVNIVGDFNENELLPILIKYFGDFNQRTALKNIQYQESLNFPKGQNKIFKFDTKIEKSLLTFNYLTTDKSDIHTARVLSLLARLVNERLRVVIREKLGESYSPFAYNYSSDLYKDYGVLKIFIYAKKSDIQKLVSYVKNMIEDLKTNQIDDDEFERIKKPLITQIKDQIKTNDYWLYSVLFNSSRYPSQKKWAKNIFEDYTQITKSEVLSAAKKYLSDERLSIVSIIPQ